jgi:hypothetical protein
MNTVLFYRLFCSFISTDRKTKCTIVLEHLAHTNEHFFGRLMQNVYDRASILYRFDTLQFDNNQQVLSVFHSFWRIWYFSDFKYILIHM